MQKMRQAKKNRPGAPNRYVCPIKRITLCVPVLGEQFLRECAAEISTYYLIPGYQSRKREGGIKEAPSKLRSLKFLDQSSFEAFKVWKQSQKVKLSKEDEDRKAEELRRKEEKRLKNRAKREAQKEALKRIMAGEISPLLPENSPILPESNL